MRQPKKALMRQPKKVLMRAARTAKIQNVWKNDVSRLILTCKVKSILILAAVKIVSTCRQVFLEEVEQ